MSNARLSRRADWLTTLPRLALRPEKGIEPWECNVGFAPGRVNSTEGSRRVEMIIIHPYSLLEDIQEAYVTDDSIGSSNSWTPASRAKFSYSPAIAGPWRALL